jgi:hypothetical protein
MGWPGRGPEYRWLLPIGGAFPVLAAGGGGIGLGGVGLGAGVVTVGAAAAGRCVPAPVAGWPALGAAAGAAGRTGTVVLAAGIAAGFGAAAGCVGTGAGGAAGWAGATGAV